MSAVAAPRLELSGHDLYLFREGTHSRLYQKLGAHLVEGATEFAVWAPNAASVAVVGDFNGWDPRRHPMRQTSDASGIWYARAPEARQGSVYKYHIVSKHAGFRVDKADPYAFRCETPPKTGSVVWDLDYEWQDAEWMRTRGRRNALDAPQAVYEVHLGSWMRSPDHPERFLGYRDLAPKLAEYVKRMGFTHVELMPIMEHPFYGSWGYQCTGYFAPSSRYGTPQDLMGFIDHLHQAGIGVILDWVPSHFPWDPHGLGFFDGTHLYEHSDPRQGHHPDWASAIFNYGRNEVRAFLSSSAHFWLEVFHADGLRVDAVASMLYLDYGRKQGEWIPNRHGGRENLDAIEFLRFLNETLYRDFPDNQTVPEEWTPGPAGAGGVARVASGVAAHVPGRPRLRREVEHGLDARHPQLHEARSGVPQAPPRLAHLQPVVRVPRELRAAPFARRGGARQGLAHRPHARRRLEAVRQPAPALRLHVGASREEAPLHGRRVRPAARVDARGQPRVARAAVPAPPGCAALGGRPESGLQGKPLLAPQGFLARRLPLGAARRLGAERALVPAPRGRRGGSGTRGVQLHAGAALQLPRRRAARRLLARAPEQRRSALRR